MNDMDGAQGAHGGLVRESRQLWSGQALSAHFRLTLSELVGYVGPSLTRTGSCRMSSTTTGIEWTDAMWNPMTGSHRTVSGAPFTSHATTRATSRSRR